MLADEPAHHLDALRVGEVDHLDPVTPHELRRRPAGALAAGEIDALADDDLADAELHGGAAAQEAGHQRRVQDGVAAPVLLADGPGAAVVLGGGPHAAPLVA